MIIIWNTRPWNKLNPDCSSFQEYKEQELDPKTKIEQLYTLDDEISNNEIFRDYAIPVPPEAWLEMEKFYNEKFEDFLSERLEGVIDDDLSEFSKCEFHIFRENIAKLNKLLKSQRSSTTGVLPKPAERILLKRLRQRGFDPTALDLSYVERGGGLYLLELFVNAAQQQTMTDSKYLSELLEETRNLGEKSENISKFRQSPVLMVKLWVNQIQGLKKWFGNDCKGILEMATATGKTVAGIGAIASLCGGLPKSLKEKFPAQDSVEGNANIMIVAHSNAILKQWEREINEKLGLPVPKKVETGEVDEIEFSGGKVEFFTAQSLLPQYDRDLAEEYDLVIYDEVHHYSNIEGFGKAIQRPNFKRALGLSATIGKESDPKRSKLEKVLAPVRYTFDLQDARENDIIPDFKWTVHTAELSPYEQEEWREATESIQNLFQGIKNSEETRRVLDDISVKFDKLEDLGDFIHARRVARINSKEVPEAWEDLDATIQSRNWIRHRSKPKLGEAVSLAERYLKKTDSPTKIVMHAMDIKTTEKIASRLKDTTENVFMAHSKLKPSSEKTRKAVQRNIDDFGRVNQGVLISPKLLDEGIDVPDAEVGINVAGTKTKLQLVQRMGRILRKSGGKKPHFYHFIALPRRDEFLRGLDSKEYTQQLNWVRELGEYIGVEPEFKEPMIDQDVIERAKRRGRQLWAQDLLEEMEVETVRGTIRLDQILEELKDEKGRTEAAKVLKSFVDPSKSTLSKEAWQEGIGTLREKGLIDAQGLQSIWWLYPLYKEEPEELHRILEQTQREGADIDEEESIMESTRKEERENKIEVRKSEEEDKEMEWPLRSHSKRKEKIKEILKSHEEYLSIKDFREIAGVDKEGKGSQGISSSLSLMFRNNELTRKKISRDLDSGDGDTYKKKIWHYQLKKRGTEERGRKNEREDKAEKMLGKDSEKARWPLQDLDTRKDRIISVLEELDEPLALRDFAGIAGVESGGKRQSRISSALVSLLREKKITRRKRKREIEQVGGGTQTLRIWHYQLAGSKDAKQKEEEITKERELSKEKKEKPDWPLQDMDVRKYNIVSILGKSEEPLSIKDLRKLTGVEKGSKRSKQIESALNSLYRDNDILEREKLPRELDGGSGNTYKKKIFHYQLKKSETEEKPSFLQMEGEQKNRKKPIQILKERLAKIWNRIFL